MMSTQFIKVACVIAPLLAGPVSAAPAAANVVAFSAIGNAAADQTPGSGGTRIFSQNSNGDIVQTCVSGPFTTGSTSNTQCGSNFEDLVIVPASEVLWQTPIAAAGLSSTESKQSHVFFLSKDRVVSEYIVPEKPSDGIQGGTSCTQCITNEGLTAADGSDLLYAMGSDSPSRALRVGFISAGAPNTLTEAVRNNGNWATSGLPS